MMYTKSIIVSAVLAAASLSAVSAAPVSADGYLQKRCLGGKCNTTNNTTSNQSQSTTISNNSNTSNASNTSQSGNQITQGNNGGGNSFGSASVGKVCGRAFFEAKQHQINDHVSMVTRNMDFSHISGLSKTNLGIGTSLSKTNPGMGKLNVSNVRVHSNTQSSTSNSNSNNTSMHVNNTKSQSSDFSGNMGVMNGVGINCRREFMQLEMERRELDSGASVLAAIGGHAVRPIDDNINLLATRDLGRLADVLGVRAAGHDADEATHYRRDIGLECATSTCDEFAKREAEEILAMHARGLGFFVEE